MKTVFRAEIIDFLDDPKIKGEAALRHFRDGLMIVDALGNIERVGDARTLNAFIDGSETVIDYRDKTIIPGFIDTHIHYVQCDIIAAYGAQLLDWLNQYTFPFEAKFSNRAYADETAHFFIDELLRNGTTSALVFASSHPNSVEAIFTAAQKRNMALIAGKVMMDRHAPAQVCDTAQSSYDDSKALIQKWHGQDRLHYALTPRFAPTSTEAQLEMVHALLKEFPDTYLQTHVAENPQEVKWVAELFPWSRSYLDVYDHYQMIFRRAIYAHCIYLDDQDRQRMSDAGATMSFCPTSNLFLGSGLFKINAAQAIDARVALGTDIGGGTSFSMLRTMHEAYKVSQMAQQKFSAYDAFYLATLGGARALDLEQQLGNFLPNKAADFTVLNTTATPLLKRRMQHVNTLEEKLFIMMMLGDEHMVHATHLKGNAVYKAPSFQ